MKRSLLDYIACPECLGDLSEIPNAGLPNHGIKPSRPEIKSVIPDVDVTIAETEIVDGLLTCRSCARWYPIRDRIPELYPDHLRGWERDLAFLRSLEPAIGPELVESLSSNTAVSSAGFSPFNELTPDRANPSPTACYKADVSHGAESALRNTADLPGAPALPARSEGESRLRNTDRTVGKAQDKPAAADPGRSWKKAEMTIAARVADPDFFSPGRTAPFNPADPESTTRAIRRFGVALALLDLKPGAVVLDAGTGYAWTSEWLSRSGFVPIGLDICRTYLEIGLRRMGAASPHLVAADVESLPIKTARLDAVLAFDAFHHVPDRPAAMRGFFRALKTPGRIVLAEPGPGHSAELHSVEVMRTYGILEKGMSLRDVSSYCRGLPGVSVREHHVFRLVRGSLPQALRTALDLVLAATALIPSRPGRSLLSEKTRTRLKKALRISDYRFFVVDKR
jgi:uncharacterized protein YbaR (Trm112 family)/SAM-dependent methyltransferase